MSLTFDPEIAAALAPMAASGFTPPAVGDVAGRRAMWEPIIGAASTAQPIPADVTTSEHYAVAEDGAQIKMRWYITDGATPGPAVLFFHGGGYIFGHIDLFDGPVSRYVSASGVPMLSVEYRRAPEHPYPTPLEDAYAALRWLNEHASELGVDPERVGVMGDSAGGGAAALTILARERGGPKIARQILLMPMLDDRTRTPDPHIAPYALWSYDDSATAWPALLGEAAGGPDVPVTAAPARLEDATGLPPAYIEVGQIDVFRDEDLAYATKLSRGGVPVEFHLHPGVPHEFDSIAFESDVARRAFADRVRVLSRSKSARSAFASLPRATNALRTRAFHAFRYRGGDDDGGAPRTPAGLFGTSYEGSRPKRPAPRAPIASRVHRRSGASSRFDQAGQSSARSAKRGSLLPS